MIWGRSISYSHKPRAHTNPRSTLDSAGIPMKMVSETCRPGHIRLLGFGEPPAPITVAFLELDMPHLNEASSAASGWLAIIIWSCNKQCAQPQVGFHTVLISVLRTKDRGRRESTPPCFATTAIVGLLPAQGVMRRQARICFAGRFDGETHWLRVGGYYLGTLGVTCESILIRGVDRIPLALDRRCGQPHDTGHRFTLSPRAALRVPRPRTTLIPFIKHTVSVFP